MRRSEEVVLDPSLTDYPSETPEQSLRFISTINSSDRIDQRPSLRTPQHPVLHKKDSFLINAWNHPNTRDTFTSTLSKRTQPKTRFGQTHKDLSASHDQSHLRKSNYKSLELKSDRFFNATNFRFGSFIAGKVRERAKTSRRSEEPDVEDVYKKERMNLIKFYQNEKLKRRLMNDTLQPQREVGFIQYPILGDPPQLRRPTNRRKADFFSRCAP